MVRRNRWWVNADQKRIHRAMQLVRRHARKHGIKIMSTYCPDGTVRDLRFQFEDTTCRGTTEAIRHIEELAK